MSNPNNRFVSPHPDGGWWQHRVASEGAEDPHMSTHRTQKDAIKAAREALFRDGGGELHIQGRNGQIRAKDTIAPGNDPRGSKG